MVTAESLGLEMAARFSIGPDGNCAVAENGEKFLGFAGGVSETPGGALEDMRGRILEYAREFSGGRLIWRERPNVSEKDFRVREFLGPKKWKWEHRKSFVAHCRLVICGG